MSDTRYCSTCGARLVPDAVLCGECGTRFREAPFQQRTSEAPGAWAAAPRRREAAEPLAAEQEAGPGIELISRDSLRPPAPEATQMRGAAHQYDRPMSAPSAPPMPGASPAWSSPPPAPSGAPAGLEPPLDGCEVGSPLQRIGAALIDGAIATVLGLPLAVGLVLLTASGGATLLVQILIGLGTAVVVALAIVVIWLQGSKALTPGKAALGLRTVRLSTGRPIGFLRSLGRHLLLAISPINLIMIVPILFEATTRRGLHDRIVDSVVVDIRRGRNPLLARPDDFARESAEHFLPSRPIPVSTHDNLMTTPGAPWGMSGSEADALWTQSAPASSPMIERSPWAPVTEARDADAEPPVRDADAEPPGRSAAEPPPAPTSSTPGSHAAPPAPGAVDQGGPADVVEDTVVPDWLRDDDDEDLDRTRVAPPARPRTVRVVLDDGSRHTSAVPVRIGRNPDAEPGHEVLAVSDATRSISKTHLALDIDGDRILVTDLGSTNGTTAVEGDESTELEPQESRTVASGTSLQMGERTLIVEIVP